ncbi:hypothetical protein NDU88_008167 [Pleurodeles waltl]|uniref:Uncharacterized protein n=1 Tax=Pleurodeles waltl TaxID=8319 RepID=A0AAV7N465_PLEWA|nr:hypothetical protein NDU88_008167 [Pleurodeles waltl]
MASPRRTPGRCITPRPGTRELVTSARVGTCELTLITAHSPAGLTRVLDLVSVWPKYTRLTPLPLNYHHDKDILHQPASWPRRAASRNTLKGVHERCGSVSLTLAPLVVTRRVSQPIPPTHTHGVLFRAEAHHGQSALYGFMAQALRILKAMPEGLHAWHSPPPQPQPYRNHAQKDSKHDTEVQETMPTRARCMAGTCPEGPDA